MSSKFIDGLMFKDPHQNAPDFVLMAGSIKREELITWLQGQSGEWINFDIKRSQKDKPYAAINDFKKAENSGGNNNPPPNYDNDVPF